MITYKIAFAPNSLSSIIFNSRNQLEMHLFIITTVLGCAGVVLPALLHHVSILMD